MKIILLRDIKGLGKKGEVKDAAEGYVQNYLVPNKMAEIATKHGIRVKEDMEKKKKRLEKKDYSKKMALAGKLNNMTFSLATKADDSGTLYAKIKLKDILKTIKNNGFDITQNDIKLRENIKHTGTYSVDLNLGGKRATINLVVEKK